MVYFNYSEFDSPDLPGSGHRYMNPEFLKMLDNARHYAGVPFKINSGYRSKEHNFRIGGSKQSSHMKGLAADISAKSSLYRYKIINALLAAGFTRIGIADTFIHVDMDTDKVQNVIWTY